jgi:hypothetical protein
MALLLQLLFETQLAQRVARLGGHKSVDPWSPGR